MEIERLEAAERLAAAAERIAAALEALASASGCRIEAAKDAAAEAVADVVPEAAPEVAPEVQEPAPAAEAERAEEPAEVQEPAPAAEPVDTKALLASIVGRVKAFCLADLANNKPKVGAIFARYGIRRVGATPEDKAVEIDAALKAELGI